MSTTERKHSGLKRNCWRFFQRRKRCYVLRFQMMTMISRVNMIVNKKRGDFPDLNQQSVWEKCDVIMVPSDLHVDCNMRTWIDTCMRTAELGSDFYIWKANYWIILIRDLLLWFKDAVRQSSGRSRGRRIDNAASVKNAGTTPCSACTRSWSILLSFCDLQALTHSYGFSWGFPHANLSIFHERSWQVHVLGSA